MAAVSLHVEPLRHTMVDFIFLIRACREMIYSSYKATAFSFIKIRRHTSYPFRVALRHQEKKNS